MTTTAMLMNKIRLPSLRRQLENARSFSGGMPWIITNFVLIAVVIGASIFAGLYVRRVAWEDAYQIHFRISLNNAIKWGYNANKVGIVNVYEKRLEADEEDLGKEPGDGRLALDYPPLRLLIVSTWAAWAEKLMHQRDIQQILDEHKNNHQLVELSKLDRARIEKHDQTRSIHPQWQNDYEYTRPMLQMNTLCEFTGAVGMFLMVHYWLRKCAGAPPQQWIQPLIGAWPALFSALLVWFSPAAIFNAHSYPQWDVWILPPFVFAIYFGMLDLWLISGICIGIVSMGKGQILMIVPAIVMWQLMMLQGGEIISQSKIAIQSIGQGKSALPHLLTIGRLLIIPLGVVLRLGVGIILAIGLVASPWLVNTVPAHHWMIWLIFATCCLLSLFFLRARTQNSLIAQASVTIVAMFMVILPWFSRARPPYFLRTYLAFWCFTAVARFLPRRWIPSWIATVIACALFACVPLFNTSMSWYWIGIKFPTEHWQLLYWCRAMNLGAILNRNFHWEFEDTINLLNYFSFLPAWHIKNDAGSLVSFWIFPMRYLMIAAYLVSIFFCAIGMAIHTRRRDRMFFFAMVAPWMLMYTLLPQMQNRYSLWAAVFAAATASFSVDGFMLYLLLNALNVLNTGLDMYVRAENTTTAEKWLPYVSPLFPDLGWAALLLAAIYLYLSLRRDRQTRPRLPALQVATSDSLPATLPAGSGFDVVNVHPNAV